MEFIASMMKGGIKGLLGGVGSLAKDLRTAITGEEAMTSEQRTKILEQVNALEILGKTIEQKAIDGQIDLNKIDAQSGSLFKGGWRPALGWVCVSGLAYSFMLKPLLPWVIKVTALIMGKVLVLPVMPILDTGEILGLVVTLLGVAGYRSFEKARGVASK